MTEKIALCADTNCLEDPIDLGLQGERILDQTWIVPFADALIARQYLRDHAVEETWVVSSDSIDGINLAAALKKDNHRSKVRLFLPSPSGSKMSRCQNAGIVPICGSNEFAQLYTAKKLDRADDLRDHRLELSADPRGRGIENPTTPPDHKPESTPSSVNVTRIERGAKASTRPLPTIDREKIPMLTDVRKSDPARVSSKADPQKNTASPSSKRITEPQPVRIARTTRPLPATDEGANVITIVSGSGGTGKSSIAAISALLAQKRGIRTLLLDADFQFGDLKYLLGYEQTLDTSDILEHPDQIDALLKVDTWPALLSAPADLEYSELMDERIGELLAYLKPHFDLIVVNTATHWSELQLQLLEASNSVFFLLDQRPSSVRACNHALDLCARCGVATTSISYLLNFCSKKSLLSSLDVSCALKGAKVFEIKDGGAEVGELLGAGMAHKLSRINNSFCTSVEALLKETVYDRIKPSLAPANETALENHSPAEKARMRTRQKRRAACF